MGHPYIDVTLEVKQRGMNINGEEGENNGL